MVVIEFGSAEKQNLDRNSLFIRFTGFDFKENLEKIKGFWNRICHGKPNWEWEVPFSCWDEIKQLYADTEICYINEPPKAKFVTENDILSGLDFNGYNLYDYQLDGVKFGLNHHNFLLLDEQGLGKTLQIISLARYKKAHENLKHCLIVCGINSLKWNWVKEVAKFCKDEEAIVLGTRENSRGKLVPMTIAETKQQIEGCPNEFFWVINIEKMRMSDEDKKNKTGIVHYLNRLIDSGELGMVVVDEIHKIKSTTSSQSKGLLAIDNRVSKIGMTGTLLVNNPYDLYCPMSFVGLINYNKWLFEQKFVVKNEWGEVMGYHNMDELHNTLYKSSIRRTKDLLDLPPKIFKQEWLEFESEDEIDVMEQLEGVKPFRLDKIEEPAEVVAMITRMRQATVACELLTSKKVTSTKFNRLKDILEEARYNGQKVLVFCPFTEALKLGMEYCAEYQPRLVCGGMGTQVPTIVAEHENQKGFSVLFAQEATLGVGFTLTNTEIVVFLSPPWSRASYDQCCDRCHRIGQKNTVQIIDLLIKDTYDELIYKKLHGKGAMSDVLIDGKEGDAISRYLDDMGMSFSGEKRQQMRSLFSIQL